MRALASVAAIALASCGGGETLRTVDVSEAGDAVVALILLDRDGAPRRALPPFGLVGGALEFGERPQVSLQGDVADVAWVRLSRSALETAYPSAWARRTAIVVSVEVPPDAPVVEPSQDALRSTWRARLPPGAEVFGAPEGVVRGAVTLRVEADAELCRQPDRTPLLPFADRPRPLDEVGVTKLRGLELLDDGRAVVAGPGGVFVLERGASFTDGPRLTGAAFGAAWLTVDRLAVDPRPHPDGPRFVAAVRLDGAPDGAGRDQDGRVLQFVLGPAGFGEVRTATVIPFGFTGVDAGPAGEIAVSARGGRVWLSGPDGAGWRRQDVPLVTTDDRSEALAFTGRPQEPLLTSVVSRVYGLSPEGRWRAYGVTLFRGTVVIRAIRVRDRIMWMAGSRNDLFRRQGGGPIEAERLLLPPRAGVCADAASVRPGKLSINRDISTLEPEAQGPILAYRQCGQLFRVRWSDRCVSVVPPGQGQISTPASFTAIRTQGDDIVAITSDGQVLISTRE